MKFDCVQFRGLGGGGAAAAIPATISVGATCCDCICDFRPLSRQFRPLALAPFCRDGHLGMVFVNLVPFLLFADKPLLLQFEAILGFCQGGDLGFEAGQVGHVPLRHFGLFSKLLLGCLHDRFGEFDFPQQVLARGVGVVIIVVFTSILSVLPATLIPGAANPFTKFMSLVISKTLFGRGEEPEEPEDIADPGP